MADGSSSLVYGDQESRDRSYDHELTALKAENVKLRADLEELRAAVHVCINGGEPMLENIDRPSGSVQGGTIRAPRWWWVLRRAIENTWSRYGKEICKCETWVP